MYYYLIIVFKNITLLYFIETKLNGKFLPNKAQHLGIPKGLLWSELAKGNTIELNGRIVYPEEVLDYNEVCIIINI